MTEPLPTSPAGRGAAVAFALALATLVALPLAHGYLPLVDWPQHLAQDAIVAHADDPTFETARYYRTTGWFLPYQGFRQAHAALARATHDDLASGRALLALALAASALSLRAIVLTLGRSPWVAVAGCALLLEANLLWGFAPYVLGTALELAQLALALRWLHRRAARVDFMGLNILALIALLGVAMFFTHVQPTALACVSVGVLALRARARRTLDPRGLAALALAMIPSAVLCGLYLTGAGWLSGHVLDDDFRIQPHTLFRAPWSALATLPTSAGLHALGGGPAVLAALSLTACLLAARAERAGHAPRKRAERAGHAPLKRAEPWDEAGTLCATFMGLYFILPWEFRGQTLAPRVASLALLSLTWVPKWTDAAANSLRARLAQGTVTLAALGTLALGHAAFARFDRALRGIDRGLLALPRGARVASLTYRTRFDDFELPVLLHVGAYALVARGGMSSSGFTRTGVTYRDEVPREALTVQQLWAPSKTGWQLDPAVHGRFYDAVFVVRGSRYPGHPFRPSSGPAPRVHRVWTDGDFELWRVLREPPRAPPFASVTALRYPKNSR
jgi:hypothetical protein